MENETGIMWIYRSLVRVYCRNLQDTKRWSCHSYGRTMLIQRTALAGHGVPCRSHVDVSCNILVSTVQEQIVPVHRSTHALLPYFANSLCMIEIAPDLYDPPNSA